ncbi:MAG: hypothetical protein WC710_14280 [Gallionella sp.]|jgi:hypothetical protein
MAQTTTQVSGVDVMIEYSSDGTTYIDISGTTNKVDVGPQDRAVGSAFTFDGDGALLTYGKRQPIDITFTIIYTETATTEAFEVLRARHETTDGAVVYLRWAPIGTGTGKNEYNTGAAKLKLFQYPPVDAGSGDPILTTFTVTASNLTMVAST